MAATSFGHLTTSDTFPPAGGYKPSDCDAKLDEAGVNVTSNPRVKSPSRGTTDKP